MRSRAKNLYLLNAALLFTHEVDSAYWREWELFGIPGGIQVFLLLNFLLFLVFLLGYGRLLREASGGHAFSLLLAVSGVFAFSVHAYFLLAGRPGFALPASLVLLAAILVVSLAQAFATVKEMRETTSRPAGSTGDMGERRLEVKSYKRAFLYGFLLWLIPFGVSLLLFPIRSAERPLFESIMPVVLTISCVLFTNLYFRKLERGFIREGIVLGLLWFVISVVIDLPLLTSSFVNMSFVDYVKDIGLTYLIFPTITTGFGYLLGRKREAKVG